MPGFTQIPNDEVFDDPLWTADKFTKGQALIDLYRLAQFKDGLVIKRGITIQLKPGQVGWSMESLRKRWRWGIGKVRRFLNTLELTGQIELQKTNVSSTITLKHWIHNDTANKHANGTQTVSQTTRKRYPNNIVNKDNTVNIEKRESTLSKEELSEFQKKYPGIDVNQSYKKFNLNMKEKGRVFEDLVAAFEKWLIRDVERGWNPRDKSNDLVTIYCPGCDSKKEVKRGTKEERLTFCKKCGQPMLGYNFYRIEKNTRKNNKVE